MPLDAVMEWPSGRAATPELRSGVRRGQGVRSMASALNRAYAAMHGYSYVYAHFPSGVRPDRSFPSWCLVAAAIALLRERKADAPAASAMTTTSSRRPYRYSWVLALDEDAAFNNAASFAAFLDAARHALPVAARSRPNSCYGRCLPPGSSELLDSDCNSDHKVSETWPPCLITVKGVRGWPGVNNGVSFLQNSRRTHKLLYDWWSAPLHLASKPERDSYLNFFPADQNALNDFVVASQTHAPCVHVLPAAELLLPGRYVTHFTGVGAHKENMFVRAHGAAALDVMRRMPEWNESACRTTRRTVRLPVLPHSTSRARAARQPHLPRNQFAAEELADFEYLLTEHCLDAARRLLTEEDRWQVLLPRNLSSLLRA
jgi:hypothetical protein